MVTAEHTPTVTAQARTRNFARVIGPFLVILTATAVVRGPQLWTQLAEYTPNPLWAWVAGAFTLLAGLIVVAFHPYWRGAAAICVSVLGWLTAIKGLALVAFPDASVSGANLAMDASGWWRAAYLVFVAIGLYLTYVGWAPPRDRPAPNPATGEQGLRPAA